MQKLGLNELRESFLSFFEDKGHLRLPSFSLVPKNDPSLLLINSGMAPLKPYFVGKESPPRKRITTCQKCIRTPDIENVGRTARHGTFFEMLGNFSFGEYFKKEAILWAWEFLTVKLGIQKDDIWVSVYTEDQEAFKIWEDDIGLDPKRIVKMGKEDNFWEHGTGPCGPCSEIYFDRGVDRGCGNSECAIGCNCDRFIEVWNLVFTQFNKDEQGNYTQLPNPNIDTGMGLERLACIMQDVDNLFEVDTVRRILDNICSLTGVKYGEDKRTDISVRVITDHIRSTTMMISDGVIPSNEGRGYVLRRLLRGAARHGKLLGLDKPFLYNISSLVIEQSKQAYPELAENSENIKTIIKIEEGKFEETIDQGLTILERYIEDTRRRGESAIGGDMVFELHGTYGFPIDLTREIAQEHGLNIDEDGFKAKMKEHQSLARQDYRNKHGSAWSETIFSKFCGDRATEFVGYDKKTVQAKVLHIIKGDEVEEAASQGDQAIVVLDRTPFYAESGGQIGDQGFIKSEGLSILVDECKKTDDGKCYLHFSKVLDGTIKVGDKVSVTIDSERRKAISRNHTATHLLHKALKDVLGSHVNQAGSLVESDRLRFDFTHFSALTQEELEEIESRVNTKVFEDLAISTNEMDIDQAKKLGAAALFNEKYDNIVRVVKIGDYSIELCGGTHLDTTSQMGFIKILGDSGIAAGVRRIEAFVGRAALSYYKDRENLARDIAQLLKTSPTDSINKIELLMDELKAAKVEIEKLRGEIVKNSLDNILSNATEKKGVKIVAARFDQLDMEALRNTSDVIKGKIESGVVVLASSFGDKVNLIVTATKDVVSRGVHSGKIIKEIAQMVGGGGGGRPDMAQAGGRDLSKINDSLKKAISIIELQIKQ